MDLVENTHGLIDWHWSVQKRQWTLSKTSTDWWILKLAEKQCTFSKTRTDIRTLDRRCRKQELAESTHSNALVNCNPDPQTPADSGNFTEKWWGKYGDFTLISCTGPGRNTRNLRLIYTSPGVGVRVAFFVSVVKVLTSLHDSCSSQLL